MLFVSSRYLSDRGWRIVARILAAALCLIALPARAQQGVQLAVECFGLGNAWRPGSWAPVRVRVDDPSPTPRELVIAMTAWDPDGDKPESRQVIASGGGSREVWLYARLPADRGNWTTRISAYRAVPTDDPDEPVRAGRLEAEVLFSPATSATPTGIPQAMPAEDGFIAVVGRRPIGLDQYRSALASSSAPELTWSVLGHERTKVVWQLRPQDIPDRWMGLSCLSTLVWAGEDPGALGTERPRAIAEWVRRGGHLVIVVPESAQGWTNPRSNPLYDMLPKVAITRRTDAVDVTPLLPLLTGTEKTDRETRVVVHDLPSIAAAEPWEAMPILADPSGAVLVSRRLVGQGMVTLVGINLMDARLATLVRAEYFWNRVLGRRGDYKDPGEFTGLRGVGNWNLHNRRAFWIDQDLPELVVKQGRSAVGLFAGVVVFAAYWLVAAPLSYAVLGRMRMRHHAWLAFVASAAAFTVLAWTSAAAIRPKRPEATHLTYIDHVFGQGVQRTRSWASILLPWYGSARVGVRGEEDFHNVIAPWESRTAPPGRSFPDARAYAFDAGMPSALSVPARATVKQFTAFWAGPPLDGWGMPRPVLGKGKTGVPALRLGAGDKPSGVLRHNLPATLEGVVVIVCSGQRPISADSAPRASPSFASAYSLPDWAPGEDLDLAKLSDGSSAPVFTEYLSRVIPPPRGLRGLTLDEDRLTGDMTQRLYALGFFSLLDPPLFDASGSDRALMRRWDVHDLDLSRWLTQPCIIVLGTLEGAPGSPSPTPFTLGPSESPRPVVTRGRTIVRWIYPLPPRPPEWAAAAPGGP